MRFPASCKRLLHLYSPAPASLLTRTQAHQRTQGQRSCRHQGAGRDARRAGGAAGQGAPTQAPQRRSSGWSATPDAHAVLPTVVSWPAAFLLAHGRIVPPADTLACGCPFALQDQELAEAHTECGRLRAALASEQAAREAAQGGNWVATEKVRSRALVVRAWLRAHACGQHTAMWQKPVAERALRTAGTAC